MSIKDFQRAVKLIEIREQDREWFPKWLRAFAKLTQPNNGGNLELSESLTLKFLRSLRDQGTPAWKRLQAARALKSYQEVILRNEAVDFEPIVTTLSEISRREKMGALQQSNLVPGEGNVGLLPEDAPKPLRMFQAKLRLLHHPINTEKTYLAWFRR